MTIQEVRLATEEIIFMPKIGKDPGTPDRPTPDEDPPTCKKKLLASQTAIELSQRYLDLQKACEKAQ
jgi:hypothetical protein